MIDPLTSSEAHEPDVYVAVEPVAAPAPRPRMTGSQRRQVILAAARREFARAGYHGASTARIAQAAGCSEPMLYKHFSGKQALFAETLDDVYLVIEARFDALFAQEGDIFTNLHGQLPAIMADAAYAEMMQLRKLAIALVTEPAVHDALVDIEHRHMKRVSDAVVKAIAAGTARPDIEPDYVAWMWTGMVLAACQREAMEPRGFVLMLPHALTFLDSLRIDSSHA
ncbi:MAG: TetR/AcrR family transcriptional regulator [Thermoleophilia bacterium]|nr:TetR/AcrR family transcriptional regulator [Thermoleophilia bacterium]